MTSISFTGDIAFSGNFKNKHNVSNLVDKHIVNFLKSSDYVIANIEGPITHNKINSSRLINHYMKPDILNFLRKINVNVWNLANNHIMDCSKSGLIDTLRNAENEKIYTVGANINKSMASKTLILGHDVKIGIISLIDEWTWMQASKNKSGSIMCTDYETINNQVIELKKAKADYIVAIIHNGYEFSKLPMKEVRNKMYKLLNLGVDIVVGHHPHVVQNYEKVGKKIIFYSLGNFIFDTDFQRLQKNTDKGVLLKINFQKHDYSFDYINTAINRQNEHVFCDNEYNPIFTNISHKEYFLLEPLLMKDYLKSKKIVENYYNIGNKKMVNIKNRVRRYLHKNTLIQEMYGYLYYLQYWRFSKNKEIVNFIRKSL